MIDKDVKTIIVISDIHAGDKFALYNPDTPLALEGGGSYQPSKYQLILWEKWLQWNHEYVPLFTKGEPYILVINGDAMEGDHHGASHPITLNQADQVLIAEHALDPAVNAPNVAALLFVRGTEIHSGEAGRNEELLAKILGAEIDEETGRHSRYELWVEMQKSLINFVHHIGATGSSSYESTGVYKELVEAYVAAGRWKRRAPDVVVRSHRHRGFEIRIPTGTGYGISLVTPGWQLKTPYTYRIPSARADTPQVGGFMIRCGDEDEIYTRFRVWDVGRPRPVVIGQERGPENGEDQGPGGRWDDHVEGAIPGHDRAGEAEDEAGEI